MTEIAKSNWVGAKGLEGKGVGIGKAHRFEDEDSSMIHEQLARLKFAETKIDFNGKSVIDFGCGTGYNSYYLAKQFKTAGITGIDIMPECIEYCENNYSADDIKYLVRDCLVFDPDLGTFDTLITTEVLEHVEDQTTFMTTAMRYLKADGTAFISTPNRATFSISKRKSFLNNTHISELFFDEFHALMHATMDDVKIYSQIHKGAWHENYMNYASAANLIQSIREDVYGGSATGKLMSRVVSKLLYGILFKDRPNGYRDVRNRRFTDFEFVEGFDNRAMWFIATGKPRR